MRSVHEFLKGDVFMSRKCPKPQCIKFTIIENKYLYLTFQQFVADYFSVDVLIDISALVAKLIIITQ